MRKLIRDIHRGKDIEKNLPRYVEYAISTYEEYGMLELTFSAYSLVEQIVEEAKELAEKESGSVDRVLAALGELGQKDCDYAAVAAAMKTLRDEITQRMELFTAYTDRMIVYEYVLNRMEMRYLPEDELSRRLSAVDENDFMAELNHYLFGDRDQSVIKDKIRMVQGQLPVRMTKSKLYERIGEAATLYRGQDCSSLESWLYMVRTSAMLCEPNHYAGEYPDLERAVRELEEADYENLTQDQYERLAEILENGAREIHAITDFYYDLQKVVNGIYAMCLILPYVKEEKSLTEKGRAIWSGLSRRECRAEMLVPLEGRIEKKVEDSSYLESVFYEIKSSYPEELERLGVTAFFEDFTQVTNLLSDSLFINLFPDVEKTADDAYVRKCTNQLFEELDEKLGKLSRPVKRAVMSMILDKLPLMFQSASEVQSYVMTNLFGCQDKAEKYAVLTMLQELMREPA